MSLLPAAGLPKKRPKGPHDKQANRFSTGTKNPSGNRGKSKRTIANTPGADKCKQCCLAMPESDYMTFPKYTDDVIEAAKVHVKSSEEHKAALECSDHFTPLSLGDGCREYCSEFRNSLEKYIPPPSGPKKSSKKKKL